MSFHKVLSRPTGVFLVTMALLVAGLMALVDLPVKLYPNTRKTRITVRIPHPSITAEDFEREYKETINRAVNTIDGVDEIETDYNNGSTRILIWFDWGYDAEDAEARVNAAMTQVRSELPAESDNMSVGYWAGRTVGFYSVAAYSPEMSSREVYEMLEPKIQPRLDRLKNIDTARVNPVDETRVDIILQPESLLRHGLTPDRVASAVRGSYRDISMGSYREGRDSFSVRVRRGIDDIHKIENVPVRTVNDTTVYLKDVADVNVFRGNPRRLYSVNGEPAVTIFAMPDQNGNIRDLANGINRIIDSVKPSLPKHLEFRKLIDPGEYINAAILNVIMAGVIGGTLAILVTFLFLGEVGNTVLVAASIPLSIFVSFNLAYSFGITVNLISLSGLTLAVGMVVDASIVVIENIHRHLRERAGGEPLVATVSRAVSEVRGAVVAACLTSIVVFLPVSLTSDLTAAVLGDLAKAVIFVIVCSALVALVVVPALATAVFSRGAGGSGKLSWFRHFVQRRMDRLVAGYRSILRPLVRSRVKSAAVVGVPLVGLVLLAVFVAPKITREIMAKPDSPRLTLRFSNAETTDEEELLEAIEPIEAQILERYGGNIDNMFARIWRATSGALTITTTDTETRDRMMRELQADFTSGDTWRFEVMRWDPAELPLPRADDLHMTFDGPDAQTIVALMDETATLLREADLYGDVDTEPSTNLTNYILLNPRLEVIEEIEGLDIEGLAAAGRIVLSGRRVVEMSHDEELMDIEIQYPEGTIRTADDMRNLLVSTPHGGVPFKHFFDVGTGKGMPEILHKEGKRAFEITADMKEGEPPWQRASIEARAQELIRDNIELPDGYSYRFHDTREEIDKATGSLLAALAISIILIYVILGVQFDSLKAPVYIMFAVPMGLIGVVSALYLADSTVSLNSLLGTILLGGIAVNNSILIYDFYQRCRERFDDPREALIHACGLRLVPIIITTLTTILGMMPIALAMGDGTNVIQPLGIAVTGGLGVSMVMTIFVIPCVLALFARQADPDTQGGDGRQISRL